MKKVFFLIFIICLSCSRNLSRFVYDRRPDEKEKDKLNYLFVEGLRLKYQGENTLALEYFNEYLKIDKSNDAVYFNLADVNLRLGNNEEAKKHLISAWNISKDNLWYNLMLSELYKQSENTDSAIFYLEQAVKIKPDSPELKLDLAQLYTNSGRYKQASLIYKEIEEKFGLNERNGLIMIKNYIDSKDYIEAERILKKMIEEFPDENLYKTLLAEVFRKAGNTGKAYEIYKNIYWNESENPQILLWMANFLIEEENDELLDDILIKVINHKEIEIKDKIFCLRNLLEKNKLIRSENIRIEEIIQEAEKVLKGNHLSELLRAEYYEKTGRLNDAVEYLKRVIEKNKENYFAWEKLLLILSEKKEYRDLYEYAKECATEFNMSYLAKIMYASAAVEIGEFQEALEEIRKAKILSGNQPEGLIQAMILEADIFYRKKEYENAYKVLEEALKIDPENNILLNNFSYYLAENDKELTKAENMINKVLNKEKENTVYLDTYAWILYKRGKNKKALKLMKIIIEKYNGEDPEYFEHYGYMLKKDGKCREAIKYWEKALEKDKGKEYLLNEIKNCR